MHGLILLFLSHNKCNGLGPRPFCNLKAMNAMHTVISIHGVDMDKGEKSPRPIRSESRQTAEPEE